VQAARNLQIELQKLGTTTNQLGTQIKGAIQGDFQTFFNSLITNSRQAGKAFEQLGVSIVQSLERIVAQMLITMAIQKVMSLLGFGSGNQQANTEKQEKTVLANTGQAQSDVFVQAIEAVPFPANLAAAPAASALVGAMMAPMAAEAAGGGLGSAAKGALLDHDMLIQAHAQEMILPADISRGMQRVIDGKQYGVPRVSAPAAIDRGGGVNNYGGDTFHLHHTGPDALAVLEKHLVPKIQEAKRRGRLGSYE